MKIFAVNTIVHREHQPVAFSVGDVLPEWAEDLVGDHCLESLSGTASMLDEAEADADSDSAQVDDDEAQTESVTEEAAPVAVDFTKPARRTAAPKK